MTPAIPNANDGPAIEVGVKFRSSLFGHVTAIRYYKGSQHTGTHVGSLWSSSGTRLATATFTNETASGWQQVNLTPPVFISANTTYVASYHSAAGYYAVTPNHFLQATANPPLTALADGTDGQNGIYRYGASAFPNQSYQQSNYWVDVVFVPDTVRPTITAMAPPGGAIDVGVDSNVTATFDETMNPASVNGTTVQLRDPADQLVPAIVTWNPATRTASLNPSIDLDPATTYAAVVRGGAGGVTDLAGNALAADHNWTFTTGTPPPPDNTPPTVTGMAPAPDAFNVLVATNVVGHLQRGAGSRHRQREHLRAPERLRPAGARLRDLGPGRPDGRPSTPPPTSPSAPPTRRRPTAEQARSRTSPAIRWPAT